MEHTCDQIYMKIKKDSIFSLEKHQKTNQTSPWLFIYSLGYFVGFDIKFGIRRHTKSNDNGNDC